MKNLMIKAKNKVDMTIIRTQMALSNNKGEGYVDTAVKILMAVEIGRAHV